MNLLKQWLLWLMAFFQPVPVLTDPIEIHEDEEPIKQSRDCTKFSRHDFDIVLERYADFLQGNILVQKHERMTRQDLVVQLNEELGLEKCLTSYSNIWNGLTNRQELKVLR